jgi:nucleoside-diphosphate-sugar epimerase
MAQANLPMNSAAGPYLGPEWSMVGFPRSLPHRLTCNSVQLLFQVTQLGHVKDLARAFLATVGNPNASRQVFNISGERFVSFDGIAKACALAMGAPEPELVHFNPKDFDFGKKKVRWAAKQVWEGWVAANHAHTLC